MAEESTKGVEPSLHVALQVMNGDADGVLEADVSFIADDPFRAS